MRTPVTIEVITSFKFAHHGYEVVEYLAGTVLEVSAECAEVALAEKWAKPKQAAKKHRPAEEAANAEESKQAAPFDTAAQQV